MFLGNGIRWLALMLVVLPSAALATDMGTLHCNDASGNSLNVGQTCAVTGVVTDMSNTSTSMRFCIQDATGGIAVFGSTTTYCGGGLGDNLTVTGAVSQYQGLTELGGNALTITLNSTGNPQPTPLVVTPAAARMAFQADNCEPLESRLIQVGPVYIRDASGNPLAVGATFAGYTTYRLVGTDGDPATDYVPMFFYAYPGLADCPGTHPLVGQTIPLSAQLVTGVLSQYDTSSPYTSSYELFPRNLSDFTPAVVIPVRSQSWGALKIIYR